MSICTVVLAYDHDNKKYSIEWEAYKPENYDALIQWDMDRMADFYEQGQDGMESELHTMEMEELIFQQNQNDELGYQDQEDNEFDEDGNVIL